VRSHKHFIDSECCGASQKAYPLWENHRVVYEHLRRGNRLTHKDKFVLQKSCIFITENLEKSQNHAKDPSLLPWLYTYMHMFVFLYTALLIIMYCEHFL
jgi:hypothetical protein